MSNRIKAISFFVLLAICFCCTTACDEESSPETITREWIDARISLDVDALIECIPEKLLQNYSDRAGRDYDTELNKVKEEFDESKKKKEESAEQNKEKGYELITTYEIESIVYFSEANLQIFKYNANEYFDFDVQNAAKVNYCMFHSRYYSNEESTDHISGFSSHVIAIQYEDEWYIIPEEILGVMGYTFPFNDIAR